MTQAPKKIGCAICRHNNRDGTCAAFPERIPFIYLAGSYAHTEVIQGQTGDFVYEWASHDEIMAKRLEAKAKRQEAAPSPV
jgi:hypothetical protein